MDTPPELTPTQETFPTQGWDTVYGLVQKRLQTFRYLSRLHEGNTHYLATILISTENLASLYETPRLKKRTCLWFNLGLSLGSLLSVASPTEFVRVFSALMSEYENERGADGARLKMKSIFLRKSTRSNSVVDLGSGSLPQEPPPNYTYMESPNVAVQLDYVQTVFALCEVLIAAYSKFLDTTDAPRSQAYIDAVLKIDSKVKKIIGTMLKDIDSQAKFSIRQELSLLDGGAGWADELTSTT